MKRCQGTGRRWVTGIAAVLLATFLPAGAAAAPAAIRAVTSHVPPCVFIDGTQATGFAIDIWNEVAGRMNAPTSLGVHGEAADLLLDVRAGKADVAVQCLLLTPERDQDFDFTYPILNTGLMVMVRDAGDGSDNRPVIGFLRLIFSRAMVVWLVGALLLVVVPAHLIWLLERRRTDGIVASHRYFPGIFAAIAWSAESLVAGAQQSPRHAGARVIGILWLYAGVVFVAVLTANLTTSMTVQQITGTIRGPDDLPGHRIGAVKETPSIAYLQTVRARIDTFHSPDEMYAALMDGRVDAVVFAAAALRYQEAQDKTGRLKTVGSEFHKKDLAFVVARDSPLRRSISSAIVAMHADGTYRRLHRKWFGAE